MSVQAEPTVPAGAGQRLQAGDGEVVVSGGEASASSDAAVARRALALVGLLAVADLWLHHHTGFGIRNIGVPAGLAAALALGVKAAGYLFGGERVKAALGGVTEPVKQALRRLVTQRLLLVSAAVLVSAMLLVSSVTVVNDEAGGAAAVRVSPLDGGAAGRSRALSGATRTIPVWTTPFGRLYRVDADGYVGASFAVYPPIGLRVQLGRELSTLPAVLFRPAPETLGFLDEGAVLTVTRARGQVVDTIAADSGYRGSYLLGRGGAITAGLVDDWERELTAGNVADDPASMAGVNSTILAWKSPRRLAGVAAELRLGDVLRAEVRFNGALVGQGEVTLEGDDLLDVRLEDVLLE
jgi:hypothetical protein